MSNAKRVANASSRASKPNVPNVAEPSVVANAPAAIRAMAKAKMAPARLARHAVEVRTRIRFKKANS